MASTLSFQAFRSSSCDPLVNLALEECLLEAPLGFEAALFLYVDDPCVVIGRNQNPWAEVAPGAGLPTLRRVSGGGAVFHDRGNLNWALVLPRGRHDPEAELGLVASALAGLGLATSSGPRGGLFAAGNSALAGRKLSGTARRFAAARVLHHGTLLVDTDLERLGSCLGGMALTSSKALASVPGEPANLSELLPGIGVEEAASALLRGIAGDRPPSSAEAAVAASAAASRLFSAARERLGSWAWTWGTTPAFSLDLRLSSGLLRLSLREGRVSSVEGAAAERLGSLLGERFSYDIAERIEEISSAP